MNLRSLLLLTILSLVWVPPAHANRYNQAAGLSAPRVQVEQEYIDKKGQRQTRFVQQAPDRDGYGNANGTQFDLAVDGAFEGETVVVLQFYNFDFSLAKEALAQKGFSVYRYSKAAPSPSELAKSLEKANQLWLISDAVSRLTVEHVDVIERFFDEGHGVYIWGDNEPYYADANLVASRLLGVTMKGDIRGDQTVNVLRRGQEFGDGGGVRRNHLVTTGLEKIYEGITIATIESNNTLTPLIYGSAGNLVTAVYERDGKRAILDGGFTRLYHKWDTAGTARYVKNAAAWLSNDERFEEGLLWSMVSAGAAVGSFSFWASAYQRVVAQ